jgi:hypothetical protein
MKKHIIALSALLTIAFNAHGATLDETVKKLQNAASTFGAQTFNKSLPTNVQNSSLVAWDQSFAQAKAFVLENSKDLLRRQDPVLMDALSKVEKVNIDFINTIKIIRNTMPNAPVSKLLGISADAKKSVDALYKTSFTLPGKTSASSLLKSVARFIEDTSKNLYNMLVIK